MSEQFESGKPGDSDTGDSPSELESTPTTSEQQGPWVPPWPAPAGGSGWQPPSGPPPGGPSAGGYPPGSPGWDARPWYPSAPASAGPSRPPRTRRYLRPLAVAGLFVASAGAGAGVGHALWASGTPAASAAAASGSAASGSSSTSGDTSGGTSDVSSIAARVDPALVDINVVFDGEGQGAATGIVLTSNGEVLTNNHVIEGATSIRVTDIGNGKTYSASVVGYDRTDDVAVIQLKGASGLTTAKIGNSSDLREGDDVVAIGNAGGTDGTPTAAGGSVTALSQAITASDEVTGTSENLTGLIETNADIQSGDSGGSLVDTSGQVVGMDTAAAEGYALSSETTQGYAIPINKALSIASEIESGDGTSTVHVGPTAYLGVLVSSSASSNSPYPGSYGDPYGQENGSATASGVAISGVVSGGPAAEAGLTQGDVITSLGGHTVTSASDITSLLLNDKPGQKVRLAWTDPTGTSHTATITLGSGPAQ